MPDGTHAVVAAFLDGEGVDARTLKRALAEPEGRDYFVDVLTLRRSLQATFESPGAAPSEPSRLGRRRLVAAAAALIVAVGGGFLIGVHRQASLDRESAISPVMVEFSQWTAAPAPTRVIELTPGLNWNDRGGH